MQVIIIKNVQKHKVNDTVDVPHGFAVNFLIPKGYALLATEANKNKLKQQVKIVATQAKAVYNHSLVLKEALSKTPLTFLLRAKNQMVFGAVSTKMVLKALQERKIKVPKFVLHGVNIRTLGTTKVPITLPGQVKTTLTIVVKAK